MEQFKLSDVRLLSKIHKYELYLKNYPVHEIHYTVLVQFELNGRRYNIDLNKVNDGDWQMARYAVLQREIQSIAEFSTEEKEIILDQILNHPKTRLVFLLFD